MTPHRITLTRSDGVDMTGEISAFAESLGLNSIAAGRYSILLVLKLFAGSKSRVQNPWKIVDQLKALEGLGPSTGAKAATPFVRAPLRGLWHQHYLQDDVASMARNLQRGLKQDGVPWFEKQVTDTIASGEERYMSGADIGQLVEDAVVGNWTRQLERASLTGEWIIFAIHQEKNYYLTLGTHDSGDAPLRSEIDAVCAHEFPFLRDLLGEEMAPGAESA